MGTRAETTTSRSASPQISGSNDRPRSPQERAYRSTAPGDDSMGTGEVPGLQNRPGLIRLTPENRDEFTVNPSFPWAEWHRLHPSWVHVETTGFRWAMTLDDGTVLLAHNEDFMPRLESAVRAVRPLMLRHRIEVPLWCESLDDPREGAGRCCPAMELGGERVPNVILLSSRERPVRLHYNAIHEVAHGVVGPGSDLDPSAPTLGHGIIYRRRFGLLLHEFLEQDRLLDHAAHLWLRGYAMVDTWAPPIHPGPERSWLWETNERRVRCPRPLPEDGGAAFDREEWLR